MEVEKTGREATGQWPKGLSSYNASWWCKTTTWVIAQVKGFCRDQERSCFVELPGKKLVKFGKRVHLSEAFALLLVAQKTTVPVPKVCQAFTKCGTTYIVMEKIDGIGMDQVWDKMSDADKDRAVEDLKGYYQQLRSIPHPRPGTICTAAADDHPLFGYRTPHWEHGAGPFLNEDDFNKYLRTGRPAGSSQHHLKALIEMQDKTRHNICFTHGDAASRNVMVRQSPSEEYRVVSLIDFEMSGFFPEYWEYVTARTPLDTSGPRPWNADVDKFLDKYPSELRMNQHRLLYFGLNGG